MPTIYSEGYSAIWEMWAKHEITNEDIRATILSGSGLDPVLLAIGVAIRTRVSGELEFGGISYLGTTKTMGGQIDSWESERKRVACGSIAVEDGLSALAAEIRSKFPSCVKGGGMLGQEGVAVQDKCPFKWLAEMSLGYAAMVSDEDVVGPAQGRRVGGPSASRYFLTVALWIPNSRSIARSDIPLRLAF